MLVDTSIWIEFFAPRPRALSAADLDELAALVTEREASIVLPIYAELLSGAKQGDRELRDLLASLPFVDLDWTASATWEAVAQLAQEAYVRRLKIPGIVDRMILAAARAAGEPLWVLDEPLRKLARAIGVPTK